MDFCYVVTGCLEVVWRKSCQPPVAGPRRGGRPCTGPAGGGGALSRNSRNRAGTEQEPHRNQTGTGPQWQRWVPIFSQTKYWPAPIFIFRNPRVIFRNPPRLSDRGHAAMSAFRANLRARSTGSCRGACRSGKTRTWRTARPRRYRCRARPSAPKGPSRNRAGTAGTEQEPSRNAQ